MAPAAARSDTTAAARVTVARTARLLVVLAAVSTCVVLFFMTPVAAQAAPAITVSHGPTDHHRIALTFDDNFYPSRALAVINVLRRYEVEATMFVTGWYVTAYPEISQAIVDGGFEVGDHTMTHPFLSKLTWNEMLAEIGGGTRLFAQQTGASTAPLLRPPYGATSHLVAEAAGAQGLRHVVLWDIDTSDWRGYSAATIRDHVLRNAHDGAIVLMHLAAPNTAEALPGIINGLRARGYELVTVSELLESGRRYADVDEDSSVGHAVLRMTDLGYMSGYNQSYFGPADTITRAQLAKVTVLVAGRHTPEVEWSAKQTFIDVPPRWDDNGNPIPYPFDYVEEVAAAGIMSGQPRDAATVFEPDRPLTRVQLAQILARMAREIKGYPQPPSAGGGVTPASRFSDAPEHATADIELVASLGLMNGTDEGRFDPWSPAQRGHVAVVMTRFIDLPAYQTPTEPATAQAADRVPSLPAASPADPSTAEPSEPATSAPAASILETPTAVAPNPEPGQ